MVVVEKYTLDGANTFILMKHKLTPICDSQPFMLTVHVVTKRTNFSKCFSFFCFSPATAPMSLINPVNYSEAEGMRITEYPLTLNKSTNTEPRLTRRRKEKSERPPWKKYWPQTPQPRNHHLLDFENRRPAMVRFLSNLQFLFIFHGMFLIFFTKNCSRRVINLEQNTLVSA